MYWNETFDREARNIKGRRATAYRQRLGALALSCRPPKSSVLDLSFLRVVSLFKIGRAWRSCRQIQVIKRFRILHQDEVGRAPYLGRAVQLHAGTPLCEPQPWCVLLITSTVLVSTDLFWPTFFFWSISFQNRWVFLYLLLASKTDGCCPAFDDDDVVHCNDTDGRSWLIVKAFLGANMLWWRHAMALLTCCDENFMAFT